MIFYKFERGFGRASRPTFPLFLLFLVHRIDLHRNFRSVLATLFVRQLTQFRSTETFENFSQSTPRTNARQYTRIAKISSTNVKSPALNYIVFPWRIDEGRGAYCPFVQRAKQRNGCLGVKTMRPPLIENLVQSARERSVFKLAHTR